MVIDYWKEVCDIGYVKFHDPSICLLADSPIELAMKLFGRKPYRFQKTLIEPRQGGNQVSLPKTMHAGPLHNDCMQYGMPAQVQVMICERQSQDGGESILLDLWPIFTTIRNVDEVLFQQLFSKIRRIKPYFQNRFALTVSLCRGNLVCVHPGLADDDEIGVGFQSFIDLAPKIVFRCLPGDIYVNNNHRMLHGRNAFSDESRRFIRILFWFIEPLPAPESLLKLAAAGTQEIAEKISKESFWVKQQFGVEAPKLSPAIKTEVMSAFKDFFEPSDCNFWSDSNFRKSRLQEAIVSALWRVISEPDFDDDHVRNVGHFLQKIYF